MTSSAIDIESRNRLGYARRKTVLMFALAAALLFANASVTQAQTYSVIYTFCSEANCADGIGPGGNLIMDGQGNLYGVTEIGGSFSGICAQIGCGTVFELTPSGSESVLYTFNTFSGGYTPIGGLTRDAGGNLYGSTIFGGSDNKACKADGDCGVVFEVTPEGTGTVLYTFTGGKDGFRPNGNLILDAQGNLYGTTIYGGHELKGGAVFKISPTGQKNTVYEFGAYKGDGRDPEAGLIMDTQGNLYGTTQFGGHRGGERKGQSCPAGGCGIVFEINAAGVETILYAFTGWKAQDGAVPSAALVMDAEGNLYGTTNYGGVYGWGTVFKLTPSGKEAVLYSFTGGADGAIPLGNVVFDAKGNLYSTTWRGGAYDLGTVFELTSSGTEKVLYNFAGGTDGREPGDGLVLDNQGNLYGTTPTGGNLGGSCSEGGGFGCGVVFKVTP